MLTFKSPVVTILTIKFNKILVPENLMLLEVTHQILPPIQMAVMTIILKVLKSICHVRPATMFVSEQRSLQYATVALV